MNEQKVHYTNYGYVSLYQFCTISNKKRIK